MAFQVPISAIPLLQDPPFILGLTWLSTALGYRALRLLRAPLEVLSSLERGVLSAALGLGLLQYLVFVPGMLGYVTGKAVLTPSLLWIELLVLVALCLPDMLRVARGLWRTVLRRRNVLPDRWTLLGLVLAIVPLGIKLLQALSPPTKSDALAYHLTAPKRWLQMGYIDGLPGLFMTYVPLGFDALFGLALAVWSDTAAQLLHYAVGILTALAIFALGRRLHSETVGFAAAVVYLFTKPLPNALSLFPWAYVEMGIGFEVVCAALAWFLWSHTRARSWLVCAALCAGFAATFKFSGAFVGLVLGLMTGYELARTRARIGQAIGSAVGFMALSAVPILPWLWRTWRLTDNPVWPLFPRLFPSRSMTSESTEDMAKFFRYNAWGTGRLGQWSPDDRQMLLFAVALALLAAAAAAYWYWKDADGRALILMTALLFLPGIWSAGLYVRYFVPFLPICYLALALMAARWLTSLRWLQAALLLMIVINGAFIAQERDPPLGDAFAAAIGRLPRQEYLTRRLPIATLWAYANANLPEGARVLNADAGGTYYIDAYCYTAGEAGPAIIRYDTYENFLNDMRRERVGYLLLGNMMDESGRMTRRQGGNDNSSQYPARLALEPGRARMIYHIGRDALFKLENPASKE